MSRAAVPAARSPCARRGRQRLIEYVMSDGRAVRVEFIDGADGVTVRESFDAEDAHSAEQQRQGWQAILDNFARHVEARG